MATDSSTAKKEILFAIDNFKQTQKMSLVNSLVSRLMNLLYAEKGSCRDMMDYGCDIASFQFEALTSELVYEIQQTITNQVNRYLPDMTASVTVTPQEDGTQHYIDIVFNLDRPVGDTNKIMFTVKKLNDKLNIEAFANSKPNI